jgi:hypothetical protein
MQWEYCKIDIGNLTSKTEAIDLLGDLGAGARGTRLKSNR